MASREVHTCDRCGREVDTRSDLELARIVIFKDAAIGTSGPTVDFPHVEMCKTCARQVERGLRDLLARQPEMAER